MTKNEETKKLKIKQDISRMIPKTADGAFIRELIFSNFDKFDLRTVKQLLIKHFPEKELDL